MYNTFDSTEFHWPTIERIYQRNAFACAKKGMPLPGALSTGIFYSMYRFMSTGFPGL